MRSIQLADRPRPRGYSDGVVARGELIFLAGQVGWTAEERFEAKDFVGQARQALLNIRALLVAAGAGPEHLVRLTWFVADRDQYLAVRKSLGEAYRQVIGDHYPAMSVVEVSGFIEPGALLEIEATAVKP